jgi:nucleotide-binding universal stress UspA family protein
MFESLLVPLDQSEFSEHSLPTAIALAGESGAALHLVHVHVPHVPDHMLSNTQYQFQGIDLDEYDRMHKVQEEEYLEEVARRASGPLPERPSTTLLDGPVPEAIQRFADQSEADLIVISRHGRGSASRLWRGSVTDALAREITKPILILHPIGRETGVSEPTHFENVLVCLDGSDACETILEPVRDLGQLGAHLTLLHVLSAQPSSLPELHMEWLEGYLQSVAREIKEDCPSVRLEVRKAREPATGILRAAKELQSDLIALATEGRGCLHRVLLGSVVEEVLRKSPVPVLLKRPPIQSGRASRRRTSPTPAAGRTSRRYSAGTSSPTPPLSLGWSKDAG